MDPESMFYVQYGCGLSAPESWTNFDISPTLRLQKVPLIGRALTRKGPSFPKGVRYGDIVTGLPLSPGSCKGVYCSHVLEHLSLADLRTALRHTFELLRPGGTFRMVLPDLELLAREYVESNDPQASMRFMRDSCLGHERRARGVEGLARQWMGNAAHLWMWDFKSLSHELRDAGFVDVRRAQLGDSADPRFRDVEDPGRWNRNLGIECKRPA
ncbi:MAG TPA: methyltransferase domain-containing protein [Tepidisphaeraceae bacterium]|nr:methyltransferase domain-containing protein [Tepidisphaeraceae bacterium]